MIPISLHSLSIESFMCFKESICTGLHGEVYIIMTLGYRVTLVHNSSVIRFYLSCITCIREMKKAS